MLEIRIYPDPILIQKARPVEDVNDSIRQLLDDMAKTMYAAVGIGLAAPQVGRSVRAIVVDASPRVDGEKLIKLVNPVITFAEGSSVSIDHLNGILFIDYLSRLKRDLIKRKLRKHSSKKNKQHERGVGVL
jgi:peptide deformylase